MLYMFLTHSHITYLNIFISMYVEKVDTTIMFNFRNRRRTEPRNYRAVASLRTLSYPAGATMQDRLQIYKISTLAENDFG
jgi:hypothetical protein